MATVSLDLFKKHVRSDDFSEDDDYLSILLEAAEAHVVGMTRRTKEELLAMNDGKSLPSQLVIAIFELGAHWYNQREAVAGTQMTEVPDSFEALVKPFRKLVSDDSGETQ